MAVSAELRMPTHKGEGIWAIHSLTRLWHVSVFM